MITETDDIALIEKERVLVIVVLNKHNFYPHVGWQFFSFRCAIMNSPFPEPIFTLSFALFISYVKNTYLNHYDNSPLDIFGGVKIGLHYIWIDIKLQN